MNVRKISRCPVIQGPGSEDSEDTTNAEDDTVSEEYDDSEVVSLLMVSCERAAELSSFISEEKVEAILIDTAVLPMAVGPKMQTKRGLQERGSIRLLIDLIPHHTNGST